MTPALLAAVCLLAEPPADARAALRSAVTYFRTHVARHGGYGYYTSADLKERWGEGRIGPDTIVVQPPGTPTVGRAYLAALAATGDPLYRAAATEAAESLVYGQLRSGGWTQVIHFAPANRMGRYRNGKGGSWDASSLDDDQTQAALGFLMRADEAFEFKHPAIHEATKYGLDALLKAQFPNGAFPQVWTGPVDATRPADKAAAFPTYDWRTAGKVKNYWDEYTLNDGLAGTVCEVLMEAHRVYKDDRYKSAVAKLGDFLIRAQLPAPQPGWSQQYNADMVPVWARKFEPPAVSGWESQDAMRTLVRIARFTGDKKYLEPVPRGLAYFRGCLLPDGRVARYYEFGTNKPLYMNARYELTHDDSQTPDHYNWKPPARFDEIERAYRDAANGTPARAAVRPVAERRAAAERAARALDEQGRWVSVYAGDKSVGQPKFPMGFRYLSSEVFARNVAALADGIAVK